MRRWMQVALLALACVLAGDSPRNAAAEHEGELTPREQAKLAAGELVTRPLAKRRSERDLIGGSSWQVIDAPPELVWRAIQDVDHYASMIPGVIEARSRREGEAARSVFLRQGVWPVIASYCVVVRVDARLWSLTFELDPRCPHDLVSGWGMIRLSAYGKRTLMTFAVRADLGHGALELIARPLVQKWALRLPETVKAFVEQRGRRLYGPLDERTQR